MTKVCTVGQHSAPTFDVGGNFLMNGKLMVIFWTLALARTANAFRLAHVFP